jgi:hypothetical protein
MDTAAYGALAIAAIVAIGAIVQIVYAMRKPR